MLFLDRANLRARHWEERPRPLGYAWLVGVQPNALSLLFVDISFQAAHLSPLQYAIVVFSLASSRPNRPPPTLLVINFFSIAAKGAVNIKKVFVVVLYHARCLVIDFPCGQSDAGGAA